MVVLSPGGDKLGDSGRIGFPATPAEIDAFLGLIRSTAPRLGPSDLDAMRARLQAPCLPAASPSRREHGFAARCGAGPDPTTVVESPIHEQGHPAG